MHVRLLCTVSASRVPWVAETLLARFFCFRQVFVKSFAALVSDRRSVGRWLPGGGGGGGTKQMFIRGGSAPRVHPLTLTYHFSRKRSPFRIPSIDKRYPFHIPCLDLCTPLNCCKYNVFYIGINHNILKP